MTRMRVGVAALVAMVAVALLAGAAPAVAQENASDVAENETETTSDVPDEYLAEVDDGVYIVDYQFEGNEVAVTWWIAEDAAPVTVQYADVGGSVRGEPGVRTPAVQTDAILQTGEVTTRYPATDGDAGQITQISVDGQPVVLEGEGTSQTTLVSYLSANEALLAGATIALMGAVLAGYKQKLDDDLDVPQNAFRGGDNG